MHLEAEHIESLLSSGEVSRVDRAHSQKLDKYINSLPWIEAGTRLDWSRMPESRRLNLAEEEAILTSWFGLTAAGRYPFLVAFYSAEEAVFGESAFVRANFDTLFWTAPGPRFLFGAKINAAASDIEVDEDSIIEFDGVETLTGVV